MKIQDLLAKTIRRLESHSDTPQLDAQVLLAHITGKNRAWVAAHPEYEMDENQLELAVKKLEAGEPLPYVLGKWEFFGLEFSLTPDVLIPRPETELLVERALTWLKANPEKRCMADIGTGSGAIAISIAKHTPNAQIIATDISPAAIQIAKRNAIKNNVHEQIEFVECDLLPNSSLRLHPSSFDLLCSNPPYIPTAILQGLSIFGREPTLALDGGADGLNVYRRLFQLAPNWLTSNGMMLLEIESTLGEAVFNLAHASFPNSEIQLHQDLAGLDRLIQINYVSQPYEVYN